MERDIAVLIGELDKQEKVIQDLEAQVDQYRAALARCGAMLKSQKVIEKENVCAEVWESKK